MAIAAKDRSVSNAMAQPMFDHDEANSIARADAQWPRAKQAARAGGVGVVRTAANQAVYRRRLTAGLQEEV